MTNCSFEIRSVQLTLVSFLSILSSFYFKFTTFGEPANEAAYDAALKKGKDELQQSYNEDNSAREASKAHAQAYDIKARKKLWVNPQVQI